MYQLYNVIFTGIAIIWFAVFDWEYEKAQLLRQPYLYKIGLEDILFNAYVFWRWFFYAFWQGTLLCYLAFYTLDTSQQSNGMLGCFQNDGNFIFGTIVTVVNLKVLVSSYAYTWPLVVSVAVGILSFYAIFIGASYWQYYDLTGNAQHLFNSPETYLTLFFFCSGYLLVDYGLVMANNEINNWLIKQKEFDQYKQRKAALKDETITRKKVTTYHSKSKYLALTLIPFFFRHGLRVLAGQGTRHLGYRHALQPISRRPAQANVQQGCIQ